MSYAISPQKPKRFSLVRLAIAAGTGTREDDSPSSFATGAAYYAERDVTLIGATLWWKRANGTSSDSVKASAWQASGGNTVRAASKTSTVAVDGGVQFIFATPILVAAGTTITLSCYGGAIQCRVPMGSSAVGVPDLFASKAIHCGDGIMLADSAMVGTGDVIPAHSGSFVASQIFGAVEPILLGDPVNTPRTLWIEGDSISAGLGTLPYSSLIVYGDGSTVKNEAVSGATLAFTAQAASYVIGSNLTALLAAYDASSPRDVVINAGTNDAYYSGATVGTAAAVGATVAASLWSIVDAVRAACPNDRIWVVTQIARNNWSTAGNYSGSVAPYNTALSTYNAAMRAGAAAHGASVIDAAADARFTDSTRLDIYQSDQCHPNLNGQKAMAHIIASALGL